LAGEAGFCGESASLRIGAAVIHRGEEPPLVGTGGSGTIFVSGCGLGCAFCQNYQISNAHEQHGEAMWMNNAERRSPNKIRNDNKGGFALANPAGAEGGGAALGREVSPETFARICAALCDRGAENINIVTGSHAVPALIEGICAARRAGVRLPVLWNSSAYENLQTLELLREYVDIFLPDLKTLDSGIAAKYFNALDYPSAATAAILKMIEMANDKPDSGAGKNIIIRHLILPGHLESTRQVLRWFADNAKGRALLSLMTQYTPIPGSEKPMPKRYLNKEEYETVLSWLDEFGIEDGFCQELVTGNEWLPDFRRHNPFSSELSVPVWPE
jgi:putative pyruvate formate lyase activating enzyme